MTDRASTLWIVLLTLASTATTLILSCATPFPALAALAAVHMRARDGVALMLATWVVSQATGFCVMGYPLSGENIGWAVALGLGAVAAALVASAGSGRIARAPLAAKLALAYVAGFVVFKLVVLVFAIGMGEVGAAFTADVLLRQFARNGAILIGLLALYHALVAMGLPRATGARPVAA
ncbi:hypothetical protein PQ455_12015 [Sphingomonas naphthae]|uniref:Uncharacterized protein n=1 Tax=Sphingomonas naphthae TaxID=1813468 RepID=A0ABY7TGK3_9SPHN|nr:hypothetical protein [Sphingomonas naphthae]WCT72362.1 hypothetical protein PQ455_12015 [Sphingomonas naphthae]